MTEVFIASAYVMMALLVVAVVVNVWFCQRLRRRFPDLWRSLGSPSGIVTTLPQIAPIGRFMRERAYDTLDDDILSKLGLWLRAIKWIFVVVFVSGALAFLILRMQ